MVAPKAGTAEVRLEVAKANATNRGRNLFTVGIGILMILMLKSNVSATFCIANPSEGAP